MPQGLSSFLVSVGIIIAIVLFIPAIESIIWLLRRRSTECDASSPEQSTDILRATRLR